MTICIRLVLTNAVFDGTTPRAYADATWTRQGQNRFDGTFADGIDVGIIDWREILEGLELEFGRLLDKVPPDAGNTQIVTDLIVERCLTNVLGEEAAPPLMGTVVQAALTLVRIREYTPEATETAGVSQLGGTGQVSNTLFANGTAGVIVLPTAMRWFIAADPAAPGDGEFAIWLEPIASPQHWAWAAQSSQPDPVFA